MVVFHVVPVRCTKEHRTKLYSLGLYIFNNKETTNFAKQNAGCRIKFENEKSRFVLLGAAPVLYTGLYVFVILYLFLLVCLFSQWWW